LGGKSGAKIYGILKSPVRREIISLLYTRGELSATQLKLLLNVSYGTLYYHLDFLKPLIVQVRRGRYRLSESGLKVAAKMLREMDEGFSLSFFEKMAASPTYCLPIGILAAMAYVLTSIILPIKSSILYLEFSNPGNILSTMMSLGITLIYFMIAGSLFCRGKEWILGVISSTLISYAPIDVYLFTLLALENTGIQLLSTVPILQAGFVAAHLIQLIILAAGLTYSGGLGWEKSLPIALFLSYISLLASYYNLL